MLDDLNQLLQEYRQYRKSQKGNEGLFREVYIEAGQFWCRSNKVSIVYWVGDTPGQVITWIELMRELCDE